MPKGPHSSSHSNVMWRTRRRSAGGGAALPARSKRGCDDCLRAPRCAHGPMAPNRRSADPGAVAPVHDSLQSEWTPEQISRRDRGAGIRPAVVCVLDGSVPGAATALASELTRRLGRRLVLVPLPDADGADQLDLVVAAALDERARARGHASWSRGRNYCRSELNPATRASRAVPCHRRPRRRAPARARRAGRMRSRPYLRPMTPTTTTRAGPLAQNTGAARRNGPIYPFRGTLRRVTMRA
jgi:hypothetical protein